MCDTLPRTLVSSRSPALSALVAAHGRLASKLRLVERHPFLCVCFCPAQIESHISQTKQRPDGLQRQQKRETAPQNRSRKTKTKSPATPLIERVVAGWPAQMRHARMHPSGTRRLDEQSGTRDVLSSVGRSTVDRRFAAAKTHGKSPD